jgi:hypothetical protein
MSHAKRLVDWKYTVNAPVRNMVDKPNKNQRITPIWDEMGEEKIYNGFVNYEKDVKPML